MGLDGMLGGVGAERMARRDAEVGGMEVVARPLNLSNPWDLPYCHVFIVVPHPLLAEQQGVCIYL